MKSFPKPVPRVTDKHAKRVQDALAWRNCCRRVDARDKYRCRVCGRHTRKTLELVPERAEHHHLIPRSVAPQHKYESWNVILVCHSPCHQQLQRHELVAVGSAGMRIDGQWCLDAYGWLDFVPSAPCEQPSIESESVDLSTGDPDD
jgi:hypothetical protein